MSLTLTIRLITCHAGRRLQRWVEDLLWEGEGRDGDERTHSEILRIKGLIAVAGDPRLHVLQAVGSTYDIMPGQPWPAGSDRTTRIVVIGADLRPDLLRAQMTSCC